MSMFGAINVHILFECWDCMSFSFCRVTFPEMIVRGKIVGGSVPTVWKACPMAGKTTVRLRISTAIHNFYSSHPDLEDTAKLLNVDPS